MSRRPCCYFWQVEWLSKLMTMWRSEAKSTLHLSATLVSQNLSFWNIFPTWPHEQFTQQGRVPQELVLPQRLSLIRPLNKFFLKRGLWSLPTWVSAASTSSTRWTSTTELPSTRSCNNRQCQSQRQVSPQPWTQEHQSWPQLTQCTAGTINLKPLTRTSTCLLLCYQGLT